MIKQIAINRIKFISGVILVFLAGYLIDISLAVPVFLICLYAYLRFRETPLKNCKLLYLVFLFAINFVSSYFIMKQKLPVFYLPFCLVPMLATVLFNDLEVSLVITFASAISIVYIAGTNFYLGVLFLISGILASLFVFGARRRSTIIRAGFIVGVLQVLTLFFIDRFWIGLPDRYLILVLNSIISSIIVIGALPIFEFLFKTVTNISLLELADFNHPLLQRMILEAPGTYHHSLVVGNLSDAASRAIGANALLARIGGYYHDIGKLEKAEYFSENQDLAGNKHDTLSADMSKLVIINHVKEGVELAKKYNLNPRLTDFILQHHGNSLVYYFYRRALETLEEDQEVKEEGFRYPGPKPNTKETAIVLLADSVEAASRALKDPAPTKIAEVTHKIINNKFIDGQLDECDLTLKDLEKISAVFIRILGGIYHSRITYPESQRSENNHKKSSKEDSHHSEKGKISSP
ncbi:MAG: HDIG domain-containing protein [Candidatus Omnitrophica bacterium]|nr:HDIG domain-containing protein [Candidatus Omnitrophota bacterium]